MNADRRRKKMRIKRRRRSSYATSALAKQVFNKHEPRLPGRCKYRERMERKRRQGNSCSTSASASSVTDDSTPEPPSNVDHVTPIVPLVFTVLVAISFLPLLLWVTRLSNLKEMIVRSAAERYVDFVYSDAYPGPCLNTVKWVLRSVSPLYVCSPARNPEVFKPASLCSGTCFGCGCRPAKIAETR